MAHITRVIHTVRMVSIVRVVCNTRAISQVALAAEPVFQSSEANLTRSMSRKACSPDNAACEGFFGRLKNELFYPRDWKGTTIQPFIEVVDDYVRWYNEKRIKISVGSLSPIE